MQWVWKILLFIGVFYVGLALLLYFLQRKMVFSPDPTYVAPELVDVQGLVEVELRSAKGHKLVNWYVPAQPGQPTLLFFHGNGGNVANREDKFRQLTARGLGVFMLGYRGFGGSEGQPSEAAFVEDARVAYDHLIGAGIGPETIVIYGESIGTSVAVQLAATVKNAGVILEAPMYSVLSIAEDRYPFFFVGMFLRDKFETNKHINNNHSPLLILHGDEDGIIPLASGQRLFAAANEPKRFHVVNGGAHNNLYEFPIVEEIVQFLQEDVVPTRSLTR